MIDRVVHLHGARGMAAAYLGGREDVAAQHQYEMDAPVFLLTPNTAPLPFGSPQSAHAPTLPPESSQNLCSMMFFQE